MKTEPSGRTKKTKARASTGTPAKATTPITPRSREPVSSYDDLHVLIAKRAYELYSERAIGMGVRSMIGWTRSGRF